MTSYAALPLFAFPALLIVAALKDVTSMTIPNWISAALVIAFIPAALLAHLPWPVVGLSLLVGLAGLVAGVAMFALRWIGGGDAKLLAAASVWIGASGAPAFLLWTAVVGGLFSIGLLLARQWGQPYAPRAPSWVGRLLIPHGDIPYGVAIAAGALMAFPVCDLARVAV